MLCRHSLQFLPWRKSEAAMSGRWDPDKRAAETTREQLRRRTTPAVCPLASVRITQRVSRDATARPQR